MYTQCSVCSAIYRIDPTVLADYRGVVRCTRCAEVFDAIESARATPYLDAKPPQGLSEPTPSAVGDRVTLRYQTRFARGWRPTLTPSADRPAPNPVEQPTSGESVPRLGLIERFTQMLPGVLILSIRNLLRNGRRTLTSMGAIGFGVVAFVIAAGFMDWILWAEREATIHSRLGHLQIVSAGFLQAGAPRPGEFLIKDDHPARAIAAANEHVRAIAPRLGFSGLVSHAETTLSFLGEGVDPSREQELSRSINIVEGENLASDDPEGIILGVGLAEILGVGVGDDFVLLVTTPNGGVNAVDAHVRGVFRTHTKAFDDSVLRVTLERARVLTRLNGSHRWALLLDDTDSTDSVLADLRLRFDEALLDLEIVPWYQQADFYNKVAALFGRQLSVLRVIIAILIVLSISNALIMSIMERTGEIGTLMALGQKQRQVLKLFFVECLLLGIVGSLIGACIGVACALLISQVGIPMPPGPGSTQSFVAEIRLTAPSLIAGVVTTLIATVVAGFYPSWRASRMQIVDALRANR